MFVPDDPLVPTLRGISEIVSLSRSKLSHDPSYKDAPDKVTRIIRPNAAPSPLRWSKLGSVHWSGSSG